MEASSCNYTVPETLKLEYILLKFAKILLPQDAGCLISQTVCNLVCKCTVLLSVICIAISKTVYTCTNKFVLFGQSFPLAGLIGF